MIDSILLTIGTFQGARCTVEPPLGWLSTVQRDPSSGTVNPLYIKTGVLE